MNEIWKEYEVFDKEDNYLGSVKAVSLKTAREEAARRFGKRWARLGEGVEV